MYIAVGASASTGGGGVLAPPFSIAAFTNHHNNRRICQHNSSIAAFPKQNHLRFISPSKLFSISAAFPKHNNHLAGIYHPSKLFDDCNRGGSLFQSRCCCCCSSEIAAESSDTSITNKSSRGVSMIDRFKSIMYQRSKQLLGIGDLQLPPHPPQYYRIINLQVIAVPQNYIKEVQFEEYFKTIKNACDLCRHFLAEQDTREMLFGDLYRKALVYLIAEFLQGLSKYCICSRSCVCLSYRDPSEGFPVFLGNPHFFYMEDNSFDNTAAYKFRLLVFVDGDKSLESIGICDNNLEHFLPWLSAFEGKFYGVQVNYKKIMLRRKKCGVGSSYSPSYRPYLFCEDP